MTDLTDPPVMGAPTNGRFGEFGGLFVPETLVPACQELEAAFREAWADPAFRAEVAKNLGAHTEWEPVLFPERFQKPASAPASGVRP